MMQADTTMTHSDAGSFSVASRNGYKFTGKERDAESGLDMFGARYYGSSMGRFMTPDPKMLSRQRKSDPQQWNMYSYSRNNPVTNFDPNGKETQSTLDPMQAQQAGYTIGNVIVGAAKGLWNAVATTANLVNSVVNGASTALTGQPLVPSAPVAQYSNTTQAVAGTIAPLAVSAGATMGSTATATSSAGAAEEALSDSALVVRGGVPTAAQLTKGAETIESDGTLSGISVNSANGATVEQLSQGIPNNKIGVTTVGDVRGIGGDVVPDPLPNNPNHCSMCNVDANKASDLFQVQQNPSNVPQD